MQRKIPGLFVLVCFIIVACSKDKFQTKPQIKIKSAKPSVMPNNSDGILEFTLEFTDKEGDLGTGTITSIRNRVNLRPLPSGVAGIDTLFNAIPEFPNKNKGEIIVSFDYNYLHQSDIENDTLVFKFIAKDRGGNVSDTIVSDKIVILKD